MTEDLGGFSGDSYQSTYSGLTADALAGRAFLKTRSEIDSQRIGMIGPSEGGAIGPLAAVQSAEVAFVVMMAGPGVAIPELIRLQTEALSRLRGDSEEQVRAVSRCAGESLAILMTEPDNEKAGARLRQLTKADVSIPFGVPGLSAQEKNLPAIFKALQAGKNPDFTVVQAPRLNHMFQTAATGSPLEYAQIQVTFSPLALRIIGDWIQARFGNR